MAIAASATAAVSNSAAAASSVTVTRTHANSDTVVVVVTTVVTTAPAPSATSVTDTGGSKYRLIAAGYNSTKLTRVEIWATNASAAVASTAVTVNVPASSNVAAAVFSYTGVVALGTTNVTTGSAANPTIAATTVDANNWVVAGFVSNVATAPTAGTGTLRTALAFSGQLDSVSLNDNTAAAAGSVTNGVTATATNWAMAALELRSASSPAPGTGQAGEYDNANKQRGVGQVLVTGLATALMPIVPLPLPLQHNNETMVAQVHHPSHNLVINADTSRGTPKTLTQDATQQVRDYPFLQADGRAVYKIPLETSRGTPLVLTAAVVNPFLPAPHQAPPKVWWQPPDTSKGIPKTLTADATAPVGEQVDNFSAAWVDPQQTLLATNTSQSTPLTLFPAAAPPLPPGQPTPQSVLPGPQRVQPESSTASPLALLAQPLPVGAGTPQSVPDKPRWQPPDTTNTQPKTLYGDATTPALNSTWTPPDRVRPVVDTSLSTPGALLTAPLPPFTPPPHYAPIRYPWLPADTSQAAPKVTYGDLTTPFFVEPHTAPDRIRPVVDTTQETPPILTAVLPPPFVPAPHLAPQRYPWLPADTSQSSGKATYADSTTPFSNSTWTAPDRVRPVVDTSQSTPGSLLSIPPAPFVPPPHFAPVKFFWQPADTSQSVSALLNPDSTIPFFNAPQFLADRVRPVVDTTQQSPLIATAVLPAPIVNAPQFMVDRVRPVTDTSQSSPLALLSFLAPPFVPGPHYGPQRFIFQPADTSQSVSALINPDSTTPFFNAPPHQADRVRPVTDTTLSSPIVLQITPLPPTNNAPSAERRIRQQIMGVSQSVRVAVSEQRRKLIDYLVETQDDDDDDDLLLM